MTAARLLVLLGFWIAGTELALGWGFVQAISSLPALALLAAAAILLVLSAIRAGRATGVAAPLRAARVLVRVGAALGIISLPMSLATRDSRMVSAGETEEVSLADGGPRIRFGDIRVAPRGPHLLSKTVEIDAYGPGDAEPVHLGLFPPTSFEGRRWSVFRFGYAPGLGLTDERGRPVAGGFVKLGTLPQSEETASLVRWTPETNLMMGAGTFPPRLEDLVSPPGSDFHVFLRLVEARLGGASRDLTDPEAYRWLLDGRPEQPVFFAQVFRGRDLLLEGRVRGGETVRFSGGALELAPNVVLWVDLLAVRDPWLPAALAGVALLALGVALRAGLAVARRARRPAAPL